jgi:hypothetical protein
VTCPVTLSGTCPRVLGHPCDTVIRCPGIEEKACGSVLASHLFICERARQRAAGRKNVLHRRALQEFQGETYEDTRRELTETENIC